MAYSLPWSHPAWVCGLKLFLIVNTVHFFWSHPAWVCGLKHDCTYSLLQISSSHPAWVCGLKLPPFSHLALRLCHTLRGCVDWNNAIPEYSNLWHVTPCVGVWIETGNDRQLCGRIVSHPAWVCGLKLSSVYSCIYIYCHTLRGCVDWNFAYLQGYRREGSHTLRGCVDWNQKNTGYLDNREVTPCVGVWIETIPLGDILSHYGVTPCVGVWIETRNSVAILAHHKVTPCVGVWIETRNPPLS